MVVISPDFDQQRLLVHYLLNNYGLLALHVPCFSVGICSQIYRAFVERKLHKRRSFYAKLAQTIVGTVPVEFMSLHLQYMLHLVLEMT